jgi:toxin ParE1/3/4
VAKKIVWTESAWIDLETVADFIARDSPYYAASFVREIRNHARSLSRMSARGRVVPEIGDRQIRELFVQSYRLIYKVERSRVAILALVHGARDLEALWTKKQS